MFFLMTFWGKLALGALGTLIVLVLVVQAFIPYRRQRAIMKNEHSNPLQPHQRREKEHVDIGKAILGNPKAKEYFFGGPTTRTTTRRG